MNPEPTLDAAALDAFVDCVGPALWDKRIGALRARAEAGRHAGRGIQQRHAIELTIERLRGRPNRPPSPAEIRIGQLAAALVAEMPRLNGRGRRRMRQMLAAGLRGEATLVPAFHLIRTALLQRSRDFEIGFAGLEEEAPFDLLLRRDGEEAEIACEVASAEAGRDLHRGAWFRLMDRIDPDLQTWLAAHPGRYLMKMTLPQGLRDGDGLQVLAGLHARIRGMLESQRRADHDEAAVLRLDPLMLAAAQADELGLMDQLRREFGPEAHLAVTAKAEGLFIMAARAGRENDVAVALRRRMLESAPQRLTGSRPGILALFLEDTDRIEWRNLRDRLELEGEARHFLTTEAARRVVAVTCASRLELFGYPAPDAAPDGEMRFRNQAHAAAKSAALAPAVLSSM